MKHHPLPRVILHNAVSLDGKIDGFLPDIGLFYKLASTWPEDATLAGCDTILTGCADAPDDDTIAVPRATTDDTRPLLVVPDSRGRLRHWNYLRSQPYWRDAVALVSKATPRDYLDHLKARRVRAIVAGAERVDFRTALRELRKRHGVQTVRVDSGGELNSVLLRAGLVDEVSLLVHPVLAGDRARSFTRTLNDSATALELEQLKKLRGGLVWLRYRVQQQP